MRACEGDDDGGRARGGREASDLPSRDVDPRLLQRGPSDVAGGARLRPHRKELHVHCAQGRDGGGGVKGKVTESNKNTYVHV